MQARNTRAAPETPSAAAIARAAEALRAGRLVAFPTETVYGLGADATNGEAVAAIFAAKRRPQFNPLIVHVADRTAAERIAVFPPMALALAAAFWPGPLTLVLPRRQDTNVSLLASAGLDTVAIRVPSHPVARDLLRAADRPLAAPSANPSGFVSSTTAAHVAEGLGDAVAMILDGGATPVGIESTIIGFDNAGLGNGRGVMLRPGAVAREEIESITGPLLARGHGGADAQAVNAPGQLASHYAPRVAVRLNADTARSGEALLAFGPHPDGARVFNLSPRGDLAEAAANLFAMLRAADASGADGIAVMPVPRHGLGEAINDRLARAAAPRMVEHT